MSRIHRAVPCVAVIGASRGIGLELVRQYAGEGWRVHATSRNPQCPGELGRIDGDVVVHGLDVVVDSQISSLAESLEPEGCDVVIHNAGVYGTGLRREEVMRINAEAPIRVAQALLGALEHGEAKKLVLMTSQMGARHGARANLGTYGESKAALNDRFRQEAPQWGRRGVIAIVVHPGWVRTDMGGAHAPLAVHQSVEGIRDLIAGLAPEHHGRFWTWDAREHPW